MTSVSGFTETQSTLTRSTTITAIRRVGGGTCFRRTTRTSARSISFSRSAPACIGALLSIAIRAELMFPGIQVFPVISQIMTGDGSDRRRQEHVQRLLYLARADHDLLHGDAGDDGRVRQLVRAVADRGAGHGLSEAEQHVVLAARRLLHARADLDVRRRRARHAWFRRRLGSLSAVRLQRRRARTRGRFRHPVDAPRRHFVDRRRDQFHRDDHQHARARHDHVSHAAVPMVGAGDGVPAAARPAGAGGRSDDAADRPQLPHDLL